MRRSALSVVLVVSCVALAATATEKTGDSVTFDPRSAAPYFESGPAAEAAAKLRREEFAGAAQDFAAYVKTHPKAKDVRQASFLRAYAELKAGRFADAAEHFDALVESYPLLVDYHHVFAARAYLQAARAQEALDRAKLTPSTSALDGDARFLRAESERALSDTAAAADGYRGYLDAYPQSWRAAEARFHLAEMLDALGKGDAARREWLALYLDAPTEAWGKQALAHLGSSPELSADELARRAMVLFDAMRNADAEAEWRRVRTLPGASLALVCKAAYHEAQSAFKARQRWRSAPLFDVAVDACSKAKDEDLLVKAIYQSARGWGQKGLDDEAATRKAAGLFERVWREHPLHSYADDARMREAELYDGLKDEAKASELYAGLPQTFTAGDQRGEALWRLGFRAWKKGDSDGAKKWLEQELQLLPREEGWWEAGRTLYWLGRIADKRNDADAPELYSRAAREYPLSYYALQALNRLREKWPDKAAALVAELANNGKATAKRKSGAKASAANDDKRDDGAWRFAPRQLFATAAFKRGVELARLGLGTEAKRELALAGIDVPRKKGAVPPDAAHEELWWLASVLYDRAGEYVLSHFIPRNLLTAYERQWPLGENRKRWLLSYPQGYKELIEKNVALTGQPAALEFAIVREESAFDPLMESFANAIGLTQLTPPPAQRFANGLPHDGRALRDPAINVAIGARELGQLWSAFAGSAALTIAGYNCGEAKVKQWMRDPQNANLVLDEFVETIPYDETRGYTKRVLASYFAYVWLYGESSTANDRIPSLMLTMPTLSKKK
jgi:soluble lytic murein transglycosylase